MNSRIEEAILFAVGDRWMKVAMVIAKVADALGRDSPVGDEGCEAISEQIEVLVHAGRLEAQPVGGYSQPLAAWTMDESTALPPPQAV